MSDSRRDKKTSDDTSLFRNTVGEVRPLNSRKRHRAETTAKTKPGGKNDATTHRESVPPDNSDLVSSPGDQLSFQRAGVTRQTMRQLRRGRIDRQGEIDLHGMTLAEAQSALNIFGEECIRERCTCVRIVHGKGLGSGPAGPVLKPNVDRWLRQWDQVLAFCSAPANDGGTGALYVLLDPQRR
ncbi:MAG: Smr/MutS family protein [Gammaproteobacteria bacterium]